MKLKLEFQAEL